tara:strand:- start:585 stop:1664 length:1080 start_codon:yes stop_codon:yes gene_type:complete
MSFSDTIESLKSSITGLISKSEDIKTTNLEKITSISTKLITIKQSVANILLIRDQFKTASESLIQSNAKIADCELKATEQIAAMAAATALFDTQKKELASQVGDKDKELELVTTDYEKKLQDNASEIATLNNDLKNNIQEVQTISEEANNKLTDIEGHGKEIEDAITGVETEIDILQTDLASTEELAQQNNAAALEPVIEGNIQETEEIIDNQETLNSINPDPSVASVASVKAPVEAPVEAPAVAPAVEPVAANKREALIKSLKKKVKEEAAEGLQQGNWAIVAQVKDEAVATLRKWDETNRGNSEKGAIYKLNDPLPSDKTYMSSAHLDISLMGGGGKKRKTTRKKRKTKKTRGRNKK